MNVIHAVTYDADNDTLTFFCDGDRTAHCHVYPDDVEGWDDSEKDETWVEHDDCWMRTWFDFGTAVYSGPDAEGCAEHVYCPPATRADIIDFDCDGDDFTWCWEGDTPPQVDGQLTLTGAGQ